MGKTPHWAAWMRVIGESELSAADRHVAIALLQWADARTGELWPSIATIMEAVGRCRRFVQEALGRIEAAGLLEYVRRSKGGRRPHRLRLRFELCDDGAPGARYDSANGARGAAQPRTASTETAHGAQLNGAPDAPELSKEQTMEQAKGTDQPPTRPSGRKTWDAEDELRRRSNQEMGR